MALATNDRKVISIKLQYFISILGAVLFSWRHPKLFQKVYKDILDPQHLIDMALWLESRATYYF